MAVYTNSIRLFHNVLPTLFGVFKFVMDDLILQVTQLLREELEDVARATFEDIEPCDGDW